MWVPLNRCENQVLEKFSDPVPALPHSKGWPFVLFWGDKGILQNGQPCPGPVAFDLSSRGSIFPFRAAVSQVELELRPIPPGGPLAATASFSCPSQLEPVSFLKLLTHLPLGLPS